MERAEVDESGVELSRGTLGRITARALLIPASDTFEITLLLALSRALNCCETPSFKDRLSGKDSALIGFDRL